MKLCLIDNKQRFVSKQPGFTLIELLFVISIIAILTVLGLSAYTSAQKSSRDAKRKSDLKFIQSALEDFRGDNFYYPFQVVPGSPFIQGNKTYMTEVPKDPTGRYEYLYQPSGTNCAAETPQNCTSYCIYAKTEFNPPSSDSACQTLPANYNYGVTRP